VAIIAQLGSLPLHPSWYSRHARNNDLQSIPSNNQKSRGKGKWLLCFGGSIKLSPADDILIRKEPLDVDYEGQMIASVLSKNLRQAPPMLLLISYRKPP
jgi:hypothetical protein